MPYGVLKFHSKCTFLLPVWQCRGCHPGVWEVVHRLGGNGQTRFVSHQITISLVCQTASAWKKVSWDMPQKSAVPLFSNPSPELHSAQPSKKKKKRFESFNAFWWWSYVSWRLFNESFWSSVLTYLMALRQKAALLSLSTKQILQSNLILRRCVWEAVRGIWSVVHSAERPNLYPMLTVYRPKLSCQLFPSACQATHTPPPVP